MLLFVRLSPGKITDKDMENLKQASGEIKNRGTPPKCV